MQAFNLFFSKYFELHGVTHFKNALFATSILLFLSMHLQAATVTVTCDNPKYTGKKLVFYNYSDPVSQTTNPVFTLETDKTGKASVTIDVQNTQFVFYFLIP